MKKGFMLIELIVATLIAAMVSVILLSALYQTNHFQAVVDDIIDVYTRATIVQHQLERDLMGVFIPVEAQQEKPEKEQEKKKEKEDKEKKAEKKEVRQERKEVKTVEHVFYSKNRNGMLDTLTFVTNNPMAIFWGAKTGRSKPKVARVKYTLQPQADRKDSFVLLRQEGYELDLAAYKPDIEKLRAYEVIDGIKDISVKFVTLIEKKEEKPKKGEEAKVIEREYRTLKEWHSEFMEPTTQQKELPRIPHFVHVRINLWDNRYRRDEAFEFTYFLPVDITPKKSAKDQENKKKEEKKGSQKKGNKENKKITVNQKNIRIKKRKQTSLSLTDFFRS